MWYTFVREKIGGGVGFMWKIQKGYESISKSFRLPIEIVNLLENLAYENNLSLNQLVIQCLNFAIDNLENSNDDVKLK